jgi:hypothetical protein
VVAAGDEPSTMNATGIVLVLATLAVGVTAGVMFCYQIAVMPGLHQLGDREFISAFQHIDRKSSTRCSSSRRSSTSSAS